MELLSAILKTFDAAFCYCTEIYVGTGTIESSTKGGGRGGKATSRENLQLPLFNL